LHKPADDEYLNDFNDTYLSISPLESLDTTVYILYAVGGLVFTGIIVVVGWITVHQCRKKVKTSASTGKNKQAMPTISIIKTTKRFDQCISLF